MRHITLIAFLSGVKYTTKNSHRDPSGQLALCAPGVFGFLSQVARSLWLLRCLAVIDVLISTNQSVQVLSNEISKQHPAPPVMYGTLNSRHAPREPVLKERIALGLVQMTTLIRRVVMHSRAWFITSWWGGVVKHLLDHWFVLLGHSTFSSYPHMYRHVIYEVCRYKVILEQGLISLNRCRCPVLTSFAFLLNYTVGINLWFGAPVSLPHIVSIILVLCVIMLP